MRQSEVFFPLADHAIVAHHVVPLSHQAFVLALSRVIQIFDSAIVTPDKVWRTSTLFASPFSFLRNKALPITNKKTAWTSDRTWRQPATAINSHQYNYDFGLLWIAGSTVLVIPQTHNIAGEKISGFERKAFTRQNSPDWNLFGFKFPTLDSGFKISGDMTEPRWFYFGFVLLCVNGKTNPVLKRSGFITNPEQFPLV